MTSLSSRLKALGVQIGAQDMPAPRRRESYPIERVVPGHFRETAHGEVFLAQKRYPLDHQHGRATLRLSSPLHTIARWAGNPHLPEADRQSFAFLDTETTGLSGGTGTYAFLVGVGRYDGAAFQLTQFFMRDPGEEPALLDALYEFLEPCNVLVTYNGKAFDMPLLKSRFVAARYLPGGEIFLPWEKATHLDLLSLARRLWRARLPGCALGQIEEYILGLSRTGEDVPGWLVPGLYFDFLRTGDARPLQNVFYHNAVDILSLAALLSHVARLLNDPTEGEAHYGVDLVAMGKLFEHLGDVDTAVQLYARALADDLTGQPYHEAVRRLSFAHKRRGNLEEATTLWRMAARAGQLYAYIELAKYCEHKQRDYAEAARWTEGAVAQVQRADLPHHARSRAMAELTHRLNRLQRKMDN
ncbi:MAG: tetratricopeptide repeat protein [Chloroflexi bacterium]|nr:tetratricopeptide repeat protein [Chloroflexota bacterium]